MHRIHIDILARQEVLQVSAEFVQSQLDFNFDEFRDLPGGIVDQDRCGARLLAAQEERTVRRSHRIGNFWIGDDKRCEAQVCFDNRRASLLQNKHAGAICRAAFGPRTCGGHAENGNRHASSKEFLEHVHLLAPPAGALSRATGVVTWVSASPLITRIRVVDGARTTRARDVIRTGAGALRASATTAASS